MTVTGAATPLDTTEAFDAEGHITYTSRYRVRSDDPMECPINVRNASGIPTYATAYTWNGVTNNYAFCQTCMSAFELSDATHLSWIVTVTHTTKPNSRQQGGGISALRTEPTAEPWKVSGSFATGTRLETFDKDGLPTLTTGLELKYFEIPDGYDTLSLEGYSQSMSLPIRAQAINHCNETAIWDLTPRQVYLAQWQHDQIFHGNGSYFHHRFDFWIKYDKWNEKWPMAGTQEFISSEPDPYKRIVPIIPTNDYGGSALRFLDLNGRVIPPPSIPAAIVNQTTEMIREFDFTTLSGSIGLPNPLPGNFV